MSLYDNLVAIDVITPILSDYKIRFTNKSEPVVFLEAVYVPTPWIHHRKIADRQCGVWHIYFNKYNIIPQACRQCWKVVMKISTLDQLFAVNQKQAASEYNCKCGLETRPITGGLGSYRAFWYAPMDKGLAGGREMFKNLCRDFPGVKLTLKRGCTEFEAVYSPSDQWDKLAVENNWDMKEELINTLFLTQRSRDAGTPKILEPSVIRKWIEWAYQHSESTGDRSWENYLEGPPMPTSQTYHSSQHKDKDYEPRTEYHFPAETDGWIEYKQQESDNNARESVLGSVQGGSIGSKNLLIKDFQSEE